VTTNDGAERRWTIGALAKATGVTVKTLHHYDEIGLVGASERTAAGHRRYTEGDLRRLYRVRALRGLGLPLEEIAEVLRRPEDDLTALRDLLAAQLAEIELRALRLEQVKDRIGGLLHQLDRSVLPGAEQFMATLETISVYETYFGQELRDHLARRRRELGVERLARLRAEWLELVREFRDHLLAGTPATDPRVRELGRRWQALTAGLAAGPAGDATTADARLDERINAAGTALWRDNAAAISAEVARDIDWLDPGELPAVLDYVRRALTTPSGE
jgi:DNA-binding transcriptional MerR regulator